MLEIETKCVGALCVFVSQINIYFRLSGLGPGTVDFSEMPKSNLNVSLSNGTIYSIHSTIQSAQVVDTIFSTFVLAPADVYLHLPSFGCSFSWN